MSQLVALNPSPVPAARATQTAKMRAMTQGWKRQGHLARRNRPGTTRRSLTRSLTPNLTRRLTRDLTRHPGPTQAADLAPGHKTPVTKFPATKFRAQEDGRL